MKSDTDMTQKTVSPVRSNATKSDTDMMQKTISPVRKTVTKSDTDMMQKRLFHLLEKLWWKVTQTVSPVRKTVTKSDTDMMQKAVSPVHFLSTITVAAHPLRMTWKVCQEPLGQS